MRKVISFHPWRFHVDQQSNNKGGRSAVAKGALLTTPELIRVNDERRPHLGFLEGRTETSGFLFPLPVSRMFSQREGSVFIRLQHPFPYYRLEAQ